ncbi:MAG: translation elongation factor Ts [Candidatus Omnitrophica bacterium]|nr:translation elongation factor Ts [Candidatus Omnitrophota bacterium]
MTKHASSSDNIKKLRELTGAGIMDCKQALGDAQNDLEKAKEILRKKGLDKAKKRSTRVAREGAVVSYVHHHGKIGVLVEVNCETDFVARCDDFKEFAKDVAMQVAAANPIYLDKESIPHNVLEKEREIAKSEVKDKPEAIQEKIIQGKIDKWAGEVCLAEQKFIRDDKKTIRDCLGAVAAKTGENIVIRRFVRFELGEETA